MKSNTKSWDKILEQQIMSSKMTFSVNPQSSKGLSSVANQITSQSYIYNSPEVKWLQLDKSKINNSADSKIMSLAIQLKEYENSGHMNVRMQLKALAAQALHEAGYPNDYTIDDYMRSNGMLPPLQEDPEMIRQLQRQITEMQESSRQRDVLLEQINQNNLQLIQGLTEAEHIINEKDEIIAERDNTIELQANQLQESQNTIIERDNTIELQANQLQESQNIITERDNTIELQANQLQERNDIIVERDNSILQLQGEKNVLTDRLATSEENNGNLTEELQGVRNTNLDLTNRLVTSEENNVNLTNTNLDLTNKLATSEEKNGDLQNKNRELVDKLAVSEAKVAPLQEKVRELKHDKEMLETDKIELREDKKMMVEYNKSLQEEKKLLLIDKKHFQDLSVTKDNELLELKHLHFDIEHCTFIGHCNNPDHE